MSLTECLYWGFPPPQTPGQRLKTILNRHMLALWGLLSLTAVRLTVTSHFYSRWLQSQGKAHYLQPQPFISVNDDLLCEAEFISEAVFSCNGFRFYRQGLFRQLANQLPKNSNPQQHSAFSDDEYPYRWQEKRGREVYQWWICWIRETVNTCHEDKYDLLEIWWSTSRSDKSHERNRCVSTAAAAKVCT